MGGMKTAGLWALALVHFFAASVFAGPKFKADLELIIPSGQTTTVNANDYLVAPGPWVLDWAIVKVPTPPSWISVDRSTGVLTINAPANSNGTFNFQLSVVTVPPVDGGDIGRFTIKLVTLPVWKVAEVDLGKIPEGTSWTFDLNPLVNDPSGSPIASFSLNDPSAKFPSIANGGWIDTSQLSKGLLSGTPSRKDVANFAGFDFVAHTVSGGSKAIPGKGAVSLVFKGPKWTANPITLPEAPQNADYRQVLSSSTYLNYTEAAPLSFTILAGGTNRNWLSVSADGTGTLTGKPLQQNAGVVSFQVRVSATHDGTVYSDTATFQTNVKLTPPSWLHDPIVLPDAFAGVTYPAQDLKKELNIPFGNQVQISFASGTDAKWASLSPAGSFSGIPALAHLGANQWRVQVSDGQNVVSAVVQVNVIKRPPSWLKNPIVLPSGFANIAYGPQSLKPFANDPDNASLSFTLVAGSGPSWGTLTPSGEFKGNPGLLNTGLNEWTVLVSNGTAEASAKLQVTIDKRPPVIQSPIVLPNATAQQPYPEQDISSKASDPDGVSLAFTLVPGSGPAWGQLSSTGKFSGTPPRTALGPNAWTVQVSNGTHIATATLRLNVVDAPPVWATEVIVLPDATAGLPYPAQDISNQATSPSGASLSFSLEPGSGPAWARMTSAGVFSGTPLVANVGPNEWTANVTDGTNIVPVTIRLNVLKRPPAWTQNPIILPDAYAATTYPLTDISQYATDPDGVRLTFSIVPGTGKPWGRVTPDGKFTGTSSPSDLGLNAWEVEVSNGHTTARTTLQVTLINGPPVWANNPLILPDAYTGLPYGPQDISKQASSPSGLSLSFRIIPGTGPGWGTLTSDGKFSGTPSRADVGLNKWNVEVSDGSNVALAEMRVTVIKRPPVWNPKPVVLPNATVAKNYDQDLAPFVTDPDPGGTLTFMQTTTSPWVFVTASGKLVGTPSQSDLGMNSLTVRATTQEGAFADVEVRIQVVPAGKPPYWKNPMLNLGDATVGQAFSFDLNPHVVVPSGLPPHFRKASAAPGWILVSDDGQVSGTPQDSDLGSYTTVFEVSDDLAVWVAVDAYGLVKQKISKPPTIEDPIRITTIVNKPIAGTLADKVSGEAPLTITKESGDGWLTIAADGALSGTPTTIKEYYFSVKVANSAGSATATLIVNVVPDAPTEQEDTVDIDTPIDGARVDNLWVVNNAQDPCSGEHCIIVELRENIDAYFDELARAKVHHYGVFLAADACTYRNPIADSRGEVLLKWDDPYWLKSFNNRISRAVGGSAYSSPLVANWLFLYSTLSKAPAPYFEKKVPMEVLYVTDEPDHFSSYAWPQISGWIPADYLAYYQSTHRKEQKPLRTSALATGWTSYSTIVNGTKGKYYRYGTANVRSALRDYAKEVIFRAVVAGQPPVKLSKKPDPATIEVKLAGALLPSTQWKYDAAKNEIEVLWHLIDMAALKAGDKLSVHYKVL